MTKHKWLMLWMLGVSAVVTALALTSATYAWFTANRQVSTDRVTSRSGSLSLELQISRTGADAFSPGTTTDAAGKKINYVALKPSDGELIPVSTADLNTFLYCPVTEEEKAKRFIPAQTDSLYYHDTVYLRAAGEGIPNDSQVELYLDNDDQNPLVRSEAGDLLTAARLGITIDGGSPVIVKVSDAPDRGDGNTYLDDALLGGGKVLSYPDETVTAIPDPAVGIRDIQYGGSPIATLELNRIYQVDIYFYLEGCDPDCLRERIYMTEAYLNLAFFGLLMQ